MSLVDTWDDPDLNAIVETFDVIRHPEVGRISVELDARSGRAIHELVERRADLIATSKLSEQLAVMLKREVHAPRPAAAIAVALEGKLMQVRFTNGRSQLYITTSQPEEVMAAIPGSEEDGFQVVVGPAERLTAVGLSELARDGHEIEMSPTVRAWMEGELHWDAQITALDFEGTPSFRVVGENEAHPHILDSDFIAAQDDEETWIVPLDKRGGAVIQELLDANAHMEVDHKARKSLERLEHYPDDRVPAGELTFEEGRDGGTAFRLTVFWSDAAAEDFTTLPGASRLAGSLTRAADELAIADAWNATALRAFTKRHDIAIDAETDALLLRLIDEHDRAEEIVEMSRATAGTMDLGAIAADLMPFQVAGIEYALDRRRTFIADEQGLGKTVQALLTIEAADAFPVVVLTPASLKLNWEREAHRWLPHRKAQVVNGRNRQAIHGEIIILNYEVVEAHREILALGKPGALVLDESHYCKSPTAKRTKSVQALADALDENALRLALTGTPLVNRPKELVSQLRILGRLTEFGSGAGFERRFGSVEERERLHWHLRRTCYLRRLKRDVLPQLPDKQRAVVPVELSNEAEYRRAEKAFMDWLTDQFSGSDQLDQKLTAAVRGKALVKIGTLRKLAGKGKVATSVSWIEDFLASGEKLVVFAQHVDVQHALADEFPDAVHILGSDGPAERDAAVQKFQNDPDTQLCVCSLRVAAHGLTLTAAANVAFVELGWTPAEHDQAEDRCHRIGQEDSVTAWYLLAANTIDDRIAALIESKRAIVGSVTDGGTGADLPAIDAILADYLSASDAPVAAVEAMHAIATVEPAEGLEAMANDADTAGVLTPDPA